MYRKWMFYLCLILVALAGLSLFTETGRTTAQGLASATPVQVIIPTTGGNEVVVTEAFGVTATPPPSPTPIGVILLEAKSEANVRAAPDLESERVGTIRAGTTYPVIGRAFRWIQFQYPDSISGTGWVYDELINIIGNAEEIEDLDANLLPTVDTSISSITQTWEAITLVPGGVLTATADARVLQIPSGNETTPSGDTSVLPVDPQAETGNAAPQVLPTFTYPPDIPTQAPDLASLAEPTTEAQLVDLSEVVSGGFAPIVPIVILGGLGILGLAFSSMRK